MRLHRRDHDLADDAEFEAMIRQLYEEVPVDADAMLRANRAYVASYIALGDE